MLIGLSLALTELASRGGGAPVPAIQIDNASIPEDAEVGDLVGALSVVNGSGSYAFSLTDDAGGLFALNGGDDTLLEVAGALDFETTTSHQVTVEADNGVDTPISRDIVITVTDVAESINIAAEGLLLTGVHGWA